MSRADGETSEAVASFLYEETLSSAEKANLQRILGTGPKTLLAAVSGGGLIYGDADAPHISLVTVTVPAGGVVGGSSLRITALIGFYQPNNGGRTVEIVINGETVAGTYPAATVGTLHFLAHIYLHPTLQKTFCNSPYINLTLSPTDGQGATYTARSETPHTVNVDMRGECVIEIRVKPVNGDTVELQGATIEQLLENPMGSAQHVSSNAVLMYGDSLIEGAGAVNAGFRLATSGTTTSGSDTITAIGSTAGVIGGMLITGPGIPDDTVVYTNGGGVITMSKNATASAAGVALMVRAGPLYRQMLVENAGQPIVNAGIGGQTAVQIVDRLVDDARITQWGVHISIGRNNVGTGTMQADVMAQLARAVAAIGHTRYVIDTITPATTEGPNSGNGLAIIECNVAIKALYGSHVIDRWDVMTNGTGVMVSDWMSDSVHYNDLGYKQLLAPTKAAWIANGLYTP